MRVTGYWFLDRPTDWQPPSDLADFLVSGPPPIYVGFGSMGNRSPEETAEMVVGALARSKQRGILLSGWRGLAYPACSDDIYFVNDVPHDWLLPRVSAVVHQGGVGTTHFGLRAGRPSIIVPYIADQYFWGQRIALLGAGPPPIPRKTLSAEELAEAIRTATTDAGMRRRAADIGHQIQGERGVENAIAEFRACFDAGPGACDRSHCTGA
jgi:UDP:flavonoid glycosyltransferase YjiC (YdhE family)